MNRYRECGQFGLCLKYILILLTLNFLQNKIFVKEAVMGGIAVQPALLDIILAHVRTSPGRDIYVLLKLGTNNLNTLHPTSQDDVDNF